MKAISVVLLCWVSDVSAFCFQYEWGSPEHRECRDAQELRSLLERERREEFWREQEMQDLEFRIERLEQDF